MKHRWLMIALGFGMSCPTFGRAQFQGDGRPLTSDTTTEASWSLDSLPALATWAQANGVRVSAVIVDLERDRRAQLNPELALNPASNMKLLTSAFALETLGATFTFRTAIFGAVGEQGQVEHLALRGDGDPTLQESDLWRLASSLRHRGIRQVNTLLVDQTAFDSQTLPPAFDQQPHESAAFRAPVSALAVERNTVTVNVLPQAENSPARIWFEPAGFVETRGTILTVGDSKSQNVQLSLSQGKDGRLIATVGGNVAAKTGRQRFTRRIVDPQLAAGHVLAHLLGELGVAVNGVKQGVVRDLPLLTYVSSPPLAQLLGAMGKQSDNFTAEMLFKALSASPNGVATFDKSAQLLTDWLHAIPGCGTAARVVNGSGLFDANRLTTACLVAVLRRAYDSPLHRDVMLAQLAVGGMDGTLRHRFTNPAIRGQVRAKTGTLNAVSALSGYILREGTQAPVVFSLLANDAAGKQYELRQLMDAVVAEIAR